MAAKMGAGALPGSGTQRGSRKVKFDPNSVGSTGLRQWGGFIDEEFLAELRGAKGARTYREMSDNDPIIGAIVFAVSMLMRQAKWSVTAADESTEAEDAKTFVEDVLEGMSRPIEHLIDEACSMFIYGYAPFEIVWKKRDDGNVGIDYIALRAQPTIYRWEIDQTTGAIFGMWQQPWSGPQVFIPIEKMLLFRTTVTRNNPEGRSMLRTAFRAWRNKKRMEEIEAIGVERDLAGLPVARIPLKYFDKDADPNDKATLAGWQSMARKIRLDQQQGIVLPSDTDARGNKLYDFELMAGGSNRAIQTSEIINRYDKQIATSVLADFIFLGQSSKGGGSYALSTDKTALFTSSISGFLKSIQAVINRDLLPRLWELNAFDPAMMPHLEPGDLENQDLLKLGGYITALSGAGMALFPDRELENHLRSEAGLPNAPDEGDGVDVETPEVPVPIVGPRAAAAVAEHQAALAPPAETGSGAGGGQAGENDQGK